MKHFIFLLIAIVFASCASHKKQGEKNSLEEKARLYYNQGTNELSQKNYTNALKYLLEANALTPNKTHILNNLGMAYYFKGKKETAIAMVKKSIELDNKNTEAKLNLGTIYTNTGNLIKADQLYKLVLDDLTYQKQYKTYYNLGVLKLRRKKTIEATNYFQQAINENENYCPAYFQLGDIYFNAKNYEKSFENYKKSGMGVCYNSPRPVYKQAVTLIKLKQYGLAKVKLEEIIERFSLTEYQQIANKTLKDLNNKIYNPEIETNEQKGNILSPDF